MTTEDRLAAKDREELHLPLVEEQVSVGKREVETDRVRVRTVVDTQDMLVEDTLRVGRVEVKRVAVDREVAEAPPTRRAGHTLIIPVVEERLVTEKRLFVVEEVHITGSSVEEPVSVPVTLRRTRAVIQRDDHIASQQGESHDGPA